MDDEHMWAIQSKSYAIAVRRTGLLRDLYRPSGASKLLGASNKVSSLEIAWKPATADKRF